MRGLTLVEILVTMVVLLILLGKGIYWMRGMAQKSLIAAEVNRVQNLIEEARHRSLAYGGGVCGVCFSTSASFDRAEVRCDTDGDGDLSDDGGYVTLRRERLGVAFSSREGRVCEVFRRGYALGSDVVFVASDGELPHESCVVIGTTRTEAGYWERRTGRCVS